MDMDGEEEEEGGTRGEKSMEADTLLLYVKQIANGNLLPNLGNSNQGSVTTQRDGKGWELEGRFRREGTDVYLWLIHVDVWQKPKQYCKAIILQLKKQLVKEIVCEGNQIPGVSLGSATTQKGSRKSHQIVKATGILTGDAANTTSFTRGKKRKLGEEK